MRSVRPFNPRCMDVWDGRAAEGFVPRLFGRLSAAVARPEAFVVRFTRPAFARSRAEFPRELRSPGCPEGTCGAGAAKCGTPTGERCTAKPPPPPKCPP